MTGASSGIGLVVARELARSGWRVIAHGRNAGRAQVAMENIRTATPGAEVEMILADLSEMAQVRRFAKDVAGRTDKIDLLVNNAGFTPSRRVETIDGMEQCFAANHMASFLLTNILLPLLKAVGPGAQIINTASVAHKFIKDMKWDDLQQVENFKASDAYTQSKLATPVWCRPISTVRVVSWSSSCIYWANPSH